MSARTRVPVFEDNEVDRSDLSQMISSFAITPVPATDGQDAIEKLDASAVDVILTDLVMPRMDGFKLLKQLSARASTTPAIVLTGFGSIDKSTTIVRDLKAYSFLEKPVQPGGLPELLERAATQNGLIEQTDRLNPELRSPGVLR